MGPQIKQVGNWVMKFIRPYPAENLRFCSTGSEATMYAIRLARASTGKRVIAKVEGGWHGYNTNLLQSVNYPFEGDEGMGLIEGRRSFIESLQFNDLERSIKVLESIKDDLAAIIVERFWVEQVYYSSGWISTRITRIAKRTESLFILDEIVTGFRFAFDGAMNLFKLDPDLFTLGKIIGGGLPLEQFVERKR